MAKIAILSDIHGNGEALNVVLDKCRTLGIEKFISLGDIVGYNADPVYCLHAVQQLDFLAMVRGNHDEYAVAGDIATSGFNQSAKIAIDWTRAQLSDEDRSYLAATPYRTQLQNITLVHATLDTPENWGYIFDVHHAADNFHYQFNQLCFCGHSHVPVAFHRVPLSESGNRPVEVLNDWIDQECDFNSPAEATIEYKKVHKYLFNIGSIGQPRNGDPRASFAVIDTDKCLVTRYMLPYDIAAIQERNLAAGLPERLAYRLAMGN